MAQVLPEIKDSLLAAGSWADFCRFREGLVSGGAKPSCALKEAVKRFLPDWEGRVTVADRRGGDSAKRRSDEISARARKAAEGVFAEKLAARMTVAGRETVPEGGSVDASAFVGKVFSSKDSVATLSWILDRLFVKDVKPEEAPSGVAWTLLMMCRRSNSFAEDFVSKSFVKMIPAKPPEDDRSGDDDFDGKIEYDILGKILDGEGR